MRLLVVLEIGFRAALTAACIWWIGWVVAGLSLAASSWIAAAASLFLAARWLLGRRFSRPAALTVALANSLVVATILSVPVAAQGVKHRFHVVDSECETDAAWAPGCVVDGFAYFDYFGEPVVVLVDSPAFPPRCLTLPFESLSTASALPQTVARSRPASACVDED